tara:strand:+ start:6784 stop:7824 length:1041 start_codon:yes stop_codon:yes gene_type:complete
MPTKAQNRYVWDCLVNGGTRNICELGGGLVAAEPLINEDMLKAIFQNQDLQLFLDSIPAELGVGDVSSNLRHKTDKEINNAVVKNTVTFLEFYRKMNDNPVVVTAFPRSHRYYSFKLNEDGSVHVKNNKIDERETDKEEILRNFFERIGLDLSKRQRMRLSSEGAGFYTYLADVLSLIVQIDYYYHPEMFEEKTLCPDVANTTTKDSSGVLRLKPVKSASGRVWEPKPGFDYLYFSEDSNHEMRKYVQKYMFPKEGSIEKVYSQFWELLRDTENGAKKMVREHFANVNEWKRWSDYSVNDVDDGITACVVLYSHMTVSNEELNDLEKRSKNKFQEIVDTWFGDLTE